MLQSDAQFHANGLSRAEEMLSSDLCYSCLFFSCSTLRTAAKGDEDSRVWNKLSEMKS